MRNCRARGRLGVRSVLTWLLTVLVAQTAQAQTVEWTRQLGGHSHGLNVADEAYGVAADGLGNAYISGYTAGDLAGPSAGNEDAFLAKYDDAGNILWTRQFGTSGSDVATSVTADRFGNVYTAGGIGGPFGTADAILGLYRVGPPNCAAFLSKFDAAGNLVWSRQLGATGEAFGSPHAIAYDVTEDGLGNVFIAGTSRGDVGDPNNTTSSGAFVSKYDASGNLLWSRKPGFAFDPANGVTTDVFGNVYIAGDFHPSDTEAFVIKYDGEGNLVWNQKLASKTYDFAWAISSDDLGNVFVAGSTEGTMPGGAHVGPALSVNAFLSKLDRDGSVVWTQQLSGFALGVSADGLGNAYLSRGTFVVKFGPSGEQIWTQQLVAGGGRDRLAVDGMGNVYFSGTIPGMPDRLGVRSSDAFLAKISDVPEPSALALGAMATAIFWPARRRFRT